MSSKSPASSKLKAASSPVSGTCEPKFARVHEAYAACFADGLELGSGVSVVVDGRTVVDLWGGHADRLHTRPWQRDTLISVWSATKGVVALAIAMLVERGVLDYEAPVARYWPEFAAAGKERITLDLVLTHRAGLNGLSVPMEEAGLIAWAPYVEALAAMAPLWEPGSHCVYHAFSYGHILGEVLRRVEQRSIGRFIAEEIAGPLGAAFFLGLPESAESRVAEMIEGPKNSAWLDALAKSDYPQSTRNPRPRALAPNDRAFRAAEVPGGNGHGTARGLARIYGMLGAGGMLDGRRIIGAEMIAAATRLRFRGTDDASGRPVAIAAGFQVESPAFVGAPLQSFGHGGWGGSTGFCDPDAKLGFGYVTNSMLAFDDGIDRRRKTLIAAVYDCL